MLSDTTGLSIRSQSLARQSLVFIYHRAGTLAFYSIDDYMTLLHRVQTTFIQPLYPGFEFVSCGASIKLRQLE